MHESWLRERRSWSGCAPRSQALIHPFRVSVNAPVLTNEASEICLEQTHPVSHAETICTAFASRTNHGELDRGGIAHGRWALSASR